MKIGLLDADGHNFPNLPLTIRKWGDSIKKLTHLSLFTGYGGLDNSVSVPVVYKIARRMEVYPCNT